MVAQLALALTLLVVAGLFIQSLRNVNRIDMGFRMDGVVTFGLRPQLNGYDAARNRALFERVENALSAQPGVAGVTASTGGVVAYTGVGSPTEMVVQGFEAGPDTNRTALLNHIGTDYFRALGIPLLAGRTFSESDTAGAPGVAVVNEAFARKFNLGRNAVGARIGRGDLDAELDTEIVGLVADTKTRFRSTVPPPLAFVPYRQGGRRRPVVLRPRVGAAGRRDALDSRARRRNRPEPAGHLPDAVVADGRAERPGPRLRGAPGFVRGARDAAGGGRALRRARLRGGAAHAASSACAWPSAPDAARLRAMVLGQIGRMTLLGVAIGLAMAFGLGRVLRSALYEIDRLPPAVVAAAVVVLAGVALAAGFVPAHRASRIDPIEALRHK